MKKYLITTVLLLLTIVPNISISSPASDIKKFRSYFFKKFPDLALQDFADGIYALNKNQQAELQAMNEFPAYEPALIIGKALFETPFKNGKTYGSCFKNAGIAIKQNYPYFDNRTGKVKTLAKELNQCRTSNKEPELNWEKNELAAIIAYMASTSRGKKIHVRIPNDSRALEIYKNGKISFYAKRGQLNFSCADCHVYYAGKLIRSNLLSPALGQVSHFPVFRKRWAFNDSGVLSGFGTIHRRYRGCYRQVRAKPFEAQSDIYTELEYFHTYMSNGIKINAPAVRP